MHNKQNLQTFYLLEKEKKNKKSIQKIDTVLFYPHTRLKRALIGWLPQSYTSLSLFFFVVVFFFCCIARRHE